MKASLKDAGDGEVAVITEIDDLVVQKQMESMLLSESIETKTAWQDRS